MSAALPILETLATIGDPTVDRALAAALTTADDVTLVAAVSLLLERRHPDGLVGVILQHHRLPEPLRDRLEHQVRDLYGPLREAAARARTAGPVNVIRIIERTRCTALLYLVSEQLKHGDSATREAAGQCMLSLARCAATDAAGLDEPELGSAAATELLQIVEDAVEHFGIHEQRSVLQAMCVLLPRPMSRSLRALGDPRHPAVEPMRRLLAEAGDPAVRRALLALVPTAILTESCLTGLRRAGLAGQLADILPDHHLLLRPEARRALLRLRFTDQILPTVQRSADLQPWQRRGLAPFAVALPIEPVQKIVWLRDLAGLSDIGARVLALRQLIALDRLAPTDRHLDAISAYCDDPSPDVARLALWRLINRGYEDLPRVLAKLINAPHPELRRMAGQRLGPVAFARLWEQWPRHQRAQRLTAGRALIKIDPCFHRRLSDKLMLPDRGTRLRAIAMIHELNQGTFFESALLALAEDVDETIASAAVRALGTVASPEAEAALKQALRDTDSRIRANAVEALAQQDATRHLDDLRRVAEEAEHRPRANAIGAMLQVQPDEAMKVLAQMLGDRRPKHRTSALWLVETLGLVEMARQVAEMSVSDPDGDVQQRANRLIQELMDLMTTTPGAEALAAQPTETAA